MSDDLLEDQIDAFKSEIVPRTKPLDFASEIEEGIQHECQIIQSILAKFHLKGDKSTLKKVLRTLIIKVFKDLDKFETLFEEFPEFLVSDLD